MNSRDTNSIPPVQDNTSVRIWYNNPPAEFDLHRHPALKIILSAETGCDVMVDRENYRLLPGDILFIPAKEYCMLQIPETDGYFVFWFDLSAISNLKDFASVQSILAKPLFLQQAGCSGNAYNDVYLLLLQIAQEYFSQKQFTELTIFSLLLTLFVKLSGRHMEKIDLFSGMRAYKQKEYIEKFDSVMNYIDSHYMEELSLEEIANSIGFSKYHFSRLFKQYTHYTFCDYVCDRRIRAAEELLQTRLSITEVALQSGFPSISTFNRVFKQQNGCTPSEYRKRSTERP